MVAPKITVKRMPIRSAIRPIRMPPTPDPIHIKALAKAGTERSPPTSAAMSLSATSVIHGAPKAIAMINRATVATIHDLRVSTDENVGCSINSRRALAGVAHWLAFRPCGDPIVGHAPLRGEMKKTFA